jgi:hypothetical protein
MSMRQDDQPERNIEVLGLVKPVPAEYRWFQVIDRREYRGYQRRQVPVCALAVPSIISFTFKITMTMGRVLRRRLVMGISYYGKKGSSMIYMYGRSLSLTRLLACTSPALV